MEGEMEGWREGEGGMMEGESRRVRELTLYHILRYSVKETTHT